MDMTMQAMSYWLETSYVGNSGGYFLFRMCGGYCVDLLEFYVRRVDQQADILACFVHLHDLHSYVHVYFRLHRSCGLCHGLRGCVDNDVLQGDLNALYVFSRLRHHADRRSFNVVLQIVSLTDLTINMFQTLHCFWILLTSKAV